MLLSEGNLFMERKVLKYKMPEGALMTVEFTLDGLQFTALNGGPIFKFNEAVSFVLTAKTRKKLIITGTSLRRAAM